MNTNTDTELRKYAEIMWNEVFRWQRIASVIFVIACVGWLLFMVMLLYVVFS